MSLFRSNHRELHCEKSVRIRIYSGTYFPVFGLNTERFFVLHVVGPRGPIMHFKTIKLFFFGTRKMLDAGKYGPE